MRGGRFSSVGAAAPMSHSLSMHLCIFGSPKMQESLPNQRLLNCSQSAKVDPRVLSVLAAKDVLPGSQSDDIEYINQTLGYKLKKPLGLFRA